MDGFDRWHLDALLGAGVLAYIAFNKLSELRLRKNAVRVDAEVFKVFPHQHATSYLVRYRHQGVERNAEFRGPPLRRTHEVGDAVPILIDARHPPHIPDPGSYQSAPGTGVGGGTCTLGTTPLVTWLDVLYAAASIAVIVRSFA